MSSQVEKQFQTDHTEHVGTSSFQQPRVGRQDFRPPAQGCSPRPCLLRCDSGLPTALASGGRAGYQPADSSRILSTLIAIHAACIPRLTVSTPQRRACEGGRLGLPARPALRGAFLPPSLGLFTH